ncbi:MAG: hypothetical protein PHE79_05060 [Eubacteriales bacterium]|nr:hypothetical protein [Eubacteriales bacterium]
MIKHTLRRLKEAVQRRKQILATRDCDNCAKRGRMDCPNSFFCYATEDKPYWVGKERAHDLS